MLGEMRIGVAIISGHILKLVGILFRVLCIKFVTILPWIGIKSLMLVMAHFDPVGTPSPDASSLTAWRAGSK